MLKVTCTRCYRCISRHLRNAVERVFGVLKRRFKILKTAPEYNFETQIDLILALTGLFVKLGMLGSVQHVTWPLRGTLIRAELLSERVHRALQ